MLTRLPEEIQVDIFLRLPAKSILRCRFVCKPLWRLLHKPKFIKDHLNHNKKNPSLMLLSNGKPKCCSIGCASILSAALSTTGTICECLQSDCRFGLQNMQVVGSCNGVICLKLDSGPTFCFWNPSTSEYIPSRLFPFEHESCTFGFGYDCHLDVYKLLSIPEGWGYCNVEVRAFDGCMSWKTIPTMKHYTFDPPGHPSSQRSLWFLNGALHWKSFVKATSSMVIVSFDLTTEKFVDFLYPEDVVNPRILYKYNHLGVMEDRLCLVVSDARKIHDCPSLLDVWCMQDYGVSESWTKQFSLKMAPCTITNEFCKVVWSCTNNGEVVLIDGGREKLLYNPKNDSITCLNIPGSEKEWEWSQPVSYVDSLVSLGSLTYSWETNANEVTKKQRLK